MLPTQKLLRFYGKSIFKLKYRDFAKLTKRKFFKAKRNAFIKNLFKTPKIYIHNGQRHQTLRLNSMASEIKIGSLRATRRLYFFPKRIKKK